MPLTIPQGQLTEGLNLAQAASYAAIAAQKHGEHSPIATKMAQLVERLVDLALMDLVAQKEDEATGDALPESPAPGTVQ